MTEELILAGARILFEQSLKRAGCTAEEIATAWPMISKPSLEFYSNSAEMVLALHDQTYRALIVEECIRFVEGGSFLHDDAPAARMARECAAEMRKQIS